MPRIWTCLPKLLLPGGLIPGHARLAQFTVAAEARLEGRQSGQPRDSCYILNSHKFPREEKYERHN